MPHAGQLFVAMLPSLQHLNVSCNTFMRQIDTARLPQLSSFTVPVLDRLCFTSTHTRSFRLRATDLDIDSNRRKWRTIIRSCGLLRCTLPMQQLTLCDERINQHMYDKDRSSHVFPAAGADSADLTRLTYLEFVDSLALVDLTYLLTPTAPPVFARQLTHLALRVQWNHRAAAAALLPSLPSMYPSLTHVHVGVQGKLHGEPLEPCVVWDAAVQLVRAAVGLAWCDRVDEVMAWREDVAWRREAGLPLQLWLPFIDI